MVPVVICCRCLRRSPTVSVFCLVTIALLNVTQRNATQRPPPPISATRTKSIFRVDKFTKRHQACPARLSLYTSPHLSRNICLEKGQAAEQGRVVKKRSSNNPSPPDRFIRFEINVVSSRFCSTTSFTSEYAAEHEFVPNGYGGRSQGNPQKYFAC